MAFSRRSLLTGFAAAPFVQTRRRDTRHTNVVMFMTDEAPGLPGPMVAAIFIRRTSTVSVPMVSVSPTHSPARRSVRPAG